MILTDDWFTTLSHTEAGALVFVTVRKGIEAFRSSGKLRDKLAILTGNYTGGGQKDWTFYTRHLPTFGERLNACLEPYPTLPLDIHCEEDPDWEDYAEMLALEQPEDEDGEA